MGIPKQIFSVSRIASKEPGRYAVNKVHFHKQHVVATDGRCMIYARHDGDSIENPMLISRDLCENVEKSKGKISKYQKPIVEVIEKDNNIEATIYPLGVTHKEPVEYYTQKKEDGTEEKIYPNFPKWKQIMPKGETELEISFDSELLTNLIETLHKVNGGNITTFRFKIGSEDADYKKPIMMMTMPPISQPV